MGRAQAAPSRAYLPRDTSPREPDLVSRKRWNELSPRSRRLIIIGGTFEGMLKIAALVDLVRRSGEEVRGSKLRWAAVIVLTNSLGAVPIAYFAYGRRRTA
jgi:hypothetical protein